jgi:hypothetical protein
VAYRALFAGSTRVIEPSPLAAAIGRIAVARHARGLAIDPAAVQPLYVRRPDAEVERERNNRRDEVNAAVARGTSGED